VLEKKQLGHRLPPQFVRRTLEDFNAGLLNADTACSQLRVGRTRLYQLRAAWLKEPDAYATGTSGGDHRGRWPAHVHAFLEDFLPLLDPPNFQLVCDELQRLHSFQRARSTVAAYCQAHLPHLVAKPPRKPRSYRRFRRARIGELWQHDSSIHQWWPAASKQVLLLTVDDHSGLNVAGRFVDADTTWNHFCHFRTAFEAHGLPEAIYTDALSLFGPCSSSDHRDPKSEFQRALKALGVAHLVAPSPQAKGKIERRFGTFQKRLVTLLAHAQVRTWEAAEAILQMEILHQNAKTNRSTGQVPDQVWAAALQASQGSIAPCPPAALLDLHLSLRTSRRVNHDQTIDFEGLAYEIAPTQRKTVTIVQHPKRKFWVLEHPPTDVWPPILGAFTL